MKKKGYVHVRLDADLDQALKALKETPGGLTIFINNEIRNWYMLNRNSLALKARIKRISESMDGFFYQQDGVKVPHSVFIEWDQTWTIADDLEISNQSTDEEIEEALRSQEWSHIDYYNDEINEYVERMQEK